MILPRIALGTLLAVGWLFAPLAESLAQDERPKWSYSPAALRPFWEGTVVEGESLLFLRDSAADEAKASTYFPIRKVLAVRDSTGRTTYEEGRDYRWKPDSREIILPPSSRIVARTPQDLRRPAKSQKYELTHRDGQGEIFFGGRLEYHEMQTTVTYEHAPDLWTAARPEYDHRALPRTAHKLLNRLPLSIVLLGDSISTGCNASGWADGEPHQPAYPELLRLQLATKFKSKVELTNLSVGGTNSAWGLTQIDKVVAARPDLVLLAFGMNDSAGVSATDFADNVRKMIAKLRESSPEVEVVLVAGMIGNRDWVRLQHDRFPEYRDALAKLREPGVALADLTSIWIELLRRKFDWDLTGNGVNHPNDFGHRVYAQVLNVVIAPDGRPHADADAERRIDAGPLRFVERRLLAGYTYSYACAAADLDGDGQLDLTSSDAESNSNLYLLRNAGRGEFRHSFIQRYEARDDQPIRLERHAIGDVDGDRRPDVVIVDNLKGDVRWFQNPGVERLAAPWPLHRVSAPGDAPGAYDVALADLDGDGDLDVAASTWSIGKRFDWYENRDGKGLDWKRHLIEGDLVETRTIAVADFDRDGKPDLLGSARGANQIVWYANSGRPATAPWKKTIIDAETIAPVHGHPVDMDGDGDLDVLMAFGLVAPVAADSPQSHQIAWYENVGRPGLGVEWKKHAIATGFSQGFEAVAGDLDGDGDLDVAATAWTPQGELAWFENPGAANAEWARHRLKQPWSNAVTVVVADLDRDGRLDILAAAERGANELRWWRNLGPRDAASAPNK